MKIAVSIIAAALCGLVSFPGIAAQIEKPVVRLSTGQEPNPPRHFGLENQLHLDKPGLSIELLRLAGKEAAVTLEFSYYPWERSLFLLREGGTDAVFHSSYQKKRTAFGAYPIKDGRPDVSRSMYTSSYMIYRRVGSKVTWDGKMFTNLKKPVGAQPSYAVIEDLERLGVPIEQVTGTDLNLIKLVGDRIDAYAEVDSIADARLASMPDLADKIEKLPKPIRVKPYFLMFSKAYYEKNTELVERIWDAIAKVRTSAEFKAIEKRYAK